jgi:hypothetical protein
MKAGISVMRNWQVTSLPADGKAAPRNHEDIRALLAALAGNEAA